MTTKIHSSKSSSVQSSLHNDNTTLLLDDSDNDDGTSISSNNNIELSSKSQYINYKENIQEFSENFTKNIPTINTESQRRTSISLQQILIHHNNKNNSNDISNDNIESFNYESLVSHQEHSNSNSLDNDHNISSINNNHQNNCKKTTENELTTINKEEIKDKDNDNDENDENDDDENMSVLSEMWTLCKMAVPISIASIVRLAMYNIDTIFLGHLGTDQLAGVALAEILMEIVTTFVYAPCWSLNGICSQTIGAGNPQLAGNWLQLTIGLSGIFCLPAYVAYYYIGDIIAIFESDNDVVHYARIFSYYAAFILFPGAIAASYRQYFQSLEVILPITIIAILTIICDAGLNQLLIYGLTININISNFNLKIFYEWNGFGFIGSPLATLISMIFQVLLYYCWCFKYKKYHIKKNAWNGLSLKSFSCERIKKLSKVVVPNMISDSTENWAYQITVIMCATLPSSDVAALACMFDLWGMLWSFYSGFGAATITKIGKQIGKGNIKKAKYLTKIALLTSTIITFIIGFLCFSLSNYIGKLYSNDKIVISIMDDSLKILSFLYFIGSIGWTAGNVMEAMSKNKIRGILYVITAWFIYLPIAMYLSFYSIIGKSCPICMIFWACLIVDSIRTILLWYILIFKTNWIEQSILAMNRSEINNIDIAKKFNISIDQVEDYINKNKKLNDKDKDKNNDTKEYIELHNEESFSTIVEFENIKNSKFELSKNENENEDGNNVVTIENVSTVNISSAA